MGKERFKLRLDLPLPFWFHGGDGEGVLGLCTNNVN